MLLLDEDITVSTPGPRLGSGAVPEVSPMTSLPWSSRGERVQVGQSRPVQLAPTPEPRRSPEPLRAIPGEGRGAAAFRRTELPETASAVFDRGYATAEAPAAETPPLRVYVGAQDPQERRTRMPIVSRIWDMNTVEDGEEEDSTASVPSRPEESDDSRRAFLRRGPEPAARPAAFERGGRWTPGRPDLTVAENLETNSGPIHAVEAPSEEVSSKIPPSFALPRPSYTGSSDQELFGGPPRRPTEAASAPTALSPATPAFEAPAEEKTSKIAIPAALAAEAEAARLAKAAAVKPAARPAEVAESGFPVMAQVAVVLIFFCLAAVAYLRFQNVDLSSFFRRSPPPVGPALVETAPPEVIPPAPVEAVPAPVPVEPAVIPPPEAPVVQAPAPPPVPKVEEVPPAPLPPAPPPVAAVAASPADLNTGFLTITADVPARVVVDGIDRGATPVTNLRLPAGTHTVEVKPVGKQGRTKVRSVRVDAGRPKTVEFGLQKTK